MTATNMCSNFGGFRCSPPNLQLSLHDRYLIATWPLHATIQESSELTTKIIEAFPSPVLSCGAIHHRQTRCSTSGSCRYGSAMPWPSESELLLMQALPAKDSE